MKRDERLALITGIVSQNEIATQEKLQEILEQQGISITQATLSRDMRELNIIKRRENGRSFYAFLHHHVLMRHSSLHQQFSRFVVKVASASVMVVVHTHLGEADLLANAIDAEKRSDVLGTIAGADTLLIICASETEAEALVAEIRDVLR